MPWTYVVIIGFIWTQYQSYLPWTYAVIVAMDLCSNTWVSMNPVPKRDIHLNTIENASKTVESDSIPVKM